MYGLFNHNKARLDKGELVDSFNFGILYARGDRGFRALFAECLKESGLTFMEWLVLGIVHHGGNKGTSMTQIAKTLGVTLPQVTALSVVLSNKRVIKQKVSARDRRTKLVHLTSRGELLFTENAKILDSQSSDWFRDFSSDEVQAFLGVLKYFAGESTV